MTDSKVKQIKATPHVIVHTESWQTEKCYKAKGAAEGAMKRTKWRSGKLKFPPTTHQVLSVEEWKAQDYEVDTFNLLNPKAGTFKIRRSQKNTCCDPATERYHSM